MGSRSKFIYTGCSNPCLKYTIARSRPNRKSIGQKVKVNKKVKVKCKGEVKVKVKVNGKVMVLLVVKLKVEAKRKI